MNVGESQLVEGLSYATFTNERGQGMSGVIVARKIVTNTQDTTVDVLQT